MTLWSDAVRLSPAGWAVIEGVARQILVFGGWPTGA